MGVFTFVCRSRGGEWSAKQHEGDLEAAAPSTYDLQRKLVQAVLGVDSSGGVTSSFSLVTPTSAVFQVVIGAVCGGALVGGGAVAAASGGGAPAATVEEPKAEEKKEDSDSEGDLGFSLFD